MRKGTINKEHVRNTTRVPDMYTIHVQKSHTYRARSTEQKFCRNLDEIVRITWRPTINVQMFLQTRENFRTWRIFWYTRNYTQKNILLNYHNFCCISFIGTKKYLVYPKECLVDATKLFHRLKKICWLVKLTYLIRVLSKLIYWSRSRIRKIFGSPNQNLAESAKEFWYYRLIKSSVHSTKDGLFKYDLSESNKYFTEFNQILVDLIKFCLT